MFRQIDKLRNFKVSRVFESETGMSTLILHQLRRVVFYVNSYDLIFNLHLISYNFLSNYENK